MANSSEWVKREMYSQYSAVVQDYLSGERESALLRAYDLGRQAAVRKVTAPALAAMHHRELVELWQRTIASDDARKPKLTAEFIFQQVSVPLEALLKGYEDARRGFNNLKDIDSQPHSWAKLEYDSGLRFAELRNEGERLRKAYDESERSLRLKGEELAATLARLRAEVTERKLTEVALRESEARFRIIFERAGLGIALLDKLGRVRESNPALQKMLGYSVGELHGRTVFDMTAAEDMDVTRRMFQELVEAQRKDYKLEQRFITKAGGLLWVRKTVSGVYGLGGDLQFVIDLVEDVTERKLAEENLLESESRFRQVADMTGEWIWEQDKEGRYIYSSSAIKAILGYTEQETLGKFYYELFALEDRQRVAPTAASVISNRETFHRIVNRYQHKNGYEVFTESTGKPILDKRGNLLKWRGVDHDITERKRFEDALRLRDRAIEASGVGIIITDPHQPGNPIIYANPAFVAMSGHSRDEVMGRNPGFLQGPGTDPVAIEAIRLALQCGNDCHLTLKNYRKDGTEFWNELLISPVRDEHGKLTNFIGIQTDVTELRRVEEDRHEMEIAKQIQLSLLPTAPLSEEGVLVAGYCLPATNVGGDYFDYFSSANVLDIVIADVSGHSVAAAMIMSEARTALKIETRQMLREKNGVAIGAATILSHLNNFLFEDLNLSDHFITMFYAKYDIETRELTYANAGHNRPLLLHGGDNGCTELDAEGLILGVRQEITFEERTVCLDKGDTVIFYTDGISEAQNKAGDFFGIRRLHDLVIANAEKSNQYIIDLVLSELQVFCQSTSFSDDITLVVMKVT